MSKRVIVVAVTGASGAVYAQRFVRQAAIRFDEVQLMVSRQAVQVANTELGLSLDESKPDLNTWFDVELANVRLLQNDSFYSPPASGSFVHQGMVIVPCSMGTAGRIAAGVSNDLVTRSADVCLKERRPLVIVPREMPWNLIQLRNMVTLTEAGAIVLPACPAWYHRPQSVEDLADTVVARILQVIGVEHGLTKAWMDEGG